MKAVWSAFTASFHSEEDCPAWGRLLTALIASARFCRKTTRRLAEIIRQNLEEKHLNIPGTAYFDPELAHLSQLLRRLCPKARLFTSRNAAARFSAAQGYAECSAFEDCAELQKLYLSDSAKGKGLGHRLMETVEDRARQAGYRRLYLETHSILDAAIRLYERRGYRSIDQPAPSVQRQEPWIASISGN